MRALVVYESLYGNTHLIAERIAHGIGELAEVDLTSVHDVTDEQLAWAEVLVVGGPTHVHGMSTSMSRRSGVEAAAKPDSGLTVEPDGEGPCLRGWFSALGLVHARHAAAFDTRMDRSAVLTGRASKGIAKRLKTHGCDLVEPPESFLVDVHNHLVEGEAERAEAWGRTLAGVALVRLGGRAVSGWGRARTLRS